VNRGHFLSCWTLRLLYGGETILQIGDALFQPPLGEFTSFGKNSFILNAQGTNSLERLKEPESHGWLPPIGENN
jgi:hypothetical protein